MKITKPYAASCDSNKDEILRILKQIIEPENFRLFEIGSGTGQHAIHFAPHFRNLQWITSDIVDNLGGIKLWLKQAKVPNVHGPEEFQVGKDEFPRQKFDVVFAANIFHILSWKDDKTLIKMLGNRLRQGAKVVFYGAFNYDGKFTSPSNQEFDSMLKSENPQSGIRNFEDVLRAMNNAGFALTQDFAMPSNNHLLYFTRLEHVATESPKGKK